MTSAAPGFPLTYALHGGRPLVDVSFTVEEVGSCAVDVLTGHSLGQDAPVRLGTFSGRLPEQTMRALTRWADAAKSEDGPMSPGTVVRSLSRRHEAPRSVAAPSSSLDDALVEAGRESLDNPLCAVEVASEVDREPGRLVIKSIGGEAFRLLLFDPDIAGFWARLQRDDPAAPEGGVYVPYEEIAALAGRGAIKQGVIELAPGESVSLPLPPGGSSTGSFIFWRAGAGAERRIVSGAWSLSTSG